MWWNYIDTEAKWNYGKTTTFSTNFIEKNITCKTENFYNLLAFSLSTIGLLIGVVFIVIWQNM